MGVRRGAPMESWCDPRTPNPSGSTCMGAHLSPPEPTPGLPGCGTRPWLHSVVRDATQEVPCVTGWFTAALQQQLKVWAEQVCCPHHRPQLQVWDLHFCHSEDGEDALVLDASGGKWRLAVVLEEVDGTCTFSPSATQAMTMGQSITPLPSSLQCLYGGDSSTQCR